MPKVSFFIPSLERGGIERTLVNLSKGLVAEGFSVDLVLAHAVEAFLQQVPKSVRIIKIGGYQLSRLLPHVLPPRVRLAVTILPGFILYLRQFRPDVLLSMQFSVIAVWGRRLARVPTRVIIRESNTITESTSQDRYWFARVVPYLKRCSYPRADAIVAVSEGVAEDLAQVLGVPREQIQVIYNPTFDEAILEKAKEAIDHPWFQPGEPPVILGVGRLTRQKDFSTLLRAFSLVRQEMSTRLVILGEGEERSRLEGLAQELGVAEEVALPGFVENPYKYMKRASVFVLSSRYEGLPNVLIEAIAMGVPVVSTDCRSGPREILMGGAAGPLVAVGDAEGLAREIVGLLQDPDRATRMVQVGQEHLRRFRPEICVRQYSELINALLSREAR